MKPHFLLCCLLVFSLGWSEEKTVSEQVSGGFSLTMTTPNSTITLLDSLALTVTLVFPSSYQTDLGQLRSHLLYHPASADAPFSLASETVIPPIVHNGSVKQSLRFILDPQYPGTQTLSFLGLLFKPIDAKTGSPVELISPLLEVMVEMPPPTKLNKSLAAPLMTLSMDFPIEMDRENRLKLLESNNPSHALHLFQEREIPWLGLCLMAIALFFIFTFTPPKKDPEKEKLNAQALAKTVAKEKLMGLNRWIDTQQIDPFYVGLTETLRDYIEQTYGLKVHSKTTEEFLHDIKLHPIFSEEMQQLLAAFLERADKIKFGRAKTTQEECKKALELALQLVEIKPA